ncbi:MAG: LLM class F420-dependent oxidoreductase [Dehalococcoidia bacterium]|nr:MAG: LLM class F420-dependent oxidoreductase [Dehalococcoidia bacterium]
MLHSRIGLMMAGAPLRDLVAIAQAADSAGLHSLWVGDGGDPFGPLTAFALATARIRLGTGVAVWHRPPVVLASAAAQLATTANGRFTLGLGAGPRQWNEDWYGIAFTRPIARMREYVTIIRGVLDSASHGPFSFAGEHFQVRSYRRSSEVPPVPIVLGTVGRQMNRLAGAVADGVLLDVLLSRRYLREVALPAIAAGRQRRHQPASREETFTIGAMVCCIADPDRRTAYQAVKWGLLGHLAADYFFPVWQDDGFGAETQLARERAAAGDPAGAVAALPDAFVETIAIAGTPDDCRRQLRSWLELVDFVALWAPRRPEAPHASTLGYLIEQFAS